MHLHVQVKHHVQLMVNSPKCEHLKEKNSVIIQVM